jgi:hypothetical protein
MPIRPLSEEFKKLSREEQEASCVGKMFLIHVSFTDHSGKELRQVKSEGTLESLDRPGDTCFGKFRLGDGRLVELMFEIDRHVFEASGKFTNVATGKSVEPAFAVSIKLGGDVDEMAKQFD